MKTLTKNNPYIPKIANLFLAIFLITVLLPFSVVLADNGENKPNKENKSTVHIKAGHLKNEGDLIKLSGGLTIKKDDITLKSPEGEFDNDKNKIFLIDGVEMDYDSGEIRSREMTGWFDEDNFIFKNKVMMDYDSKDDKDKKFTLQSSHLDLNSETKSFTAKDNVLIDYDKKIIKGDKADYDDKKELLIITENVNIRKENGDWVKSDRAEFDLSTGEEDFTAEGNVEIEISLEEEAAEDK